MTYDPDSPAGNQYRLPLDSATSAGTPAKKKQAATPAPASGGTAAAEAPDPNAGLFGAGITTPKDEAASGAAGGASAKATKSGSKTSDSDAAARADAPAEAAEPQARTPLSARADSPAESISGTNASLITGGVVVLLGLGAGLLIRMTARRRDGIA